MRYRDEKLSIKPILNYSEFLEIDGYAIPLSPKGSNEIYLDFNKPNKIKISSLPEEYLAIYKKLIKWNNSIDTINALLDQQFDKMIKNKSSIEAYNSSKDTLYRRKIDIIKTARTDLKTFLNNNHDKINSIYLALFAKVNDDFLINTAPDNKVLLRKIYLNTKSNEKKFRIVKYLGNVIDEDEQRSAKQPKGKTQLQIGKKISDIILNDAANNQISLYDLKADFKMILFIDNDCAECFYERRMLKVKWHNIKKRLVVYEISVDRNKDYQKWKQVIQSQYPYEWIQVKDSDKFLDSYFYKLDIKSTPFAILVDGKQHTILNKGFSIATLEQLIK